MMLITARGSGAVALSLMESVTSKTRLESDRESTNLDPRTLEHSPWTDLFVDRSEQATILVPVGGMVGKYFGLILNSARSMWCSLFN